MTEQEASEEPRMLMQVAAVDPGWRNCGVVVMTLWDEDPRVWEITYADVLDLLEGKTAKAATSDRVARSVGTLMGPSTELGGMLHGCDAVLVERQFRGKALMAIESALHALYPTTTRAVSKRQVDSSLSKGSYSENKLASEAKHVDALNVYFDSLNMPRPKKGLKGKAHHMCDCIEMILATFPQ